MILREAFALQTEKAYGFESSIRFYHHIRLMLFTQMLQAFRNLLHHVIVFI